jgi:predicted RNase H-like nuclease
MATLLVGFDSAWTPTNTGAICGVLQRDDGTYQELGSPLIANFPEAEALIAGWQVEYKPTATLILLDQPTIVKNLTGQRPVEHVICSSVSFRYGGMQPANIAREVMFGPRAPVWSFLSRFGGAADPRRPLADTRVFEIYPVLAMIALGWVLKDSRPGGRLPKYNPQRKKTFAHTDWLHVCGLLAAEFTTRGLAGVTKWVDGISGNLSPRKSDQDKVDACLCLLVALHLVERKDCLMIGNLETGYIGHCQRKRLEPSSRCS